MKIKKILIVVESLDVEDSSGTKGRVALIRNLQKAGFDLAVYHYTRKPVENIEGVKLFAIKEKKWNFLYFMSRTQRKLQSGLKVNMSQFLEDLFGFSFTFLNDANSLVKAIKVNNFEPDLVITLSKAASFRPHYALLKLPQYHEKWMAYVHDPFPFHCYPKPYDWKMPGAAKKEKFFKEVAQKARFSAFPSKLLQEWMGNFFPKFLETGVVIPHQMLEEKTLQIEPPIYFDLKKFNVLHAGALLKQRPPDYLILGFEKFLRKNPDAVKNSKLLLIGSSSYHIDKLKVSSANILQLYVSDGYVPYAEVRWLQENVDVNVVLEAKADISPFLPGKFPHCVAANRTILHLGPRKSEVRRLLGENYRYWSETEDVDKVAVLLGELFQKWKNTPEELKLNRKDLEQYLSVAHLQEVMQSVLITEPK